jgi:hypothetical protein
LATGSALTFDGSTLGVSASIAAATLASSGAYSALSFTNSGGATKAGLILTNSNGILQSRAETSAWTNYDASTEYMRLTSTGLGIGTSSPDAKLDVASGNAEAIRLSSNSYLSAGQGPWIGFDGGPSSTWNLARIQGTRAGAEFQGNLLFFTNNSASDATAAIERMRLDASGNLGIGTSSPTQKLDVAGQVTISSGNGYLWGNGAVQIYSNSSYLRFRTASTDRLEIDASGNLGLGVTPSAWSQGRAIEVFGQGYGIWNGTASIYSIANAYFNSGFKYANTGVEASHYYQFQGQHVWSTAPSGTAGNAITFTQAMTLDASGNLGIGTSSPSYKIHASGTGTVFSSVTSTNGTAVLSAFSASGSDVALLLNAGGLETARIISPAGAGVLAFGTGSAGTERMRLDASGNLLVGTTTASAGAVFKVTGTTANSISHQVWSTASSSNAAYWTEGSSTVNGVATGANAAGTMIRINKDSGNLRSINAAGTLNAAGADYAEYMTKAGDFTVAKGDVVGIDTNGKLTNVFSDAISFVVKSTNPSYVGGDTWGVDLDKDALEAARQTVDRIAFCGQVPVNVTGATVGQYIIPINENGAIKGKAVSNPTFEQYQSAVGKVIAIEADGRARILVKIA